MSIVERQSRLLDDCLDSLKSWNDLIMKYGAENKSELRNAAKDITKTYAFARFEAEKQDDALKRIENHIEECSDETPDFDTMFQTLQADNTSELDVAESEVWNKVFGYQDVEEVEQENESINASNYEELEDSILCSEVFKVPVDPLTKKKILEPCRNRQCKHVYENTSILEYIHSMRRKAKCPYMGCGNQRLLASDLVKDETLQAKILEFMEKSQNVSKLSKTS